MSIYASKFQTLWGLALFSAYTHWNGADTKTLWLHSVVCSLVQLLGENMKAKILIKNNKTKQIQTENTNLISSAHILPELALQANIGAN